jgi:hypothetical protein
MAIHTKGYVSKEITQIQVAQAIETLFGTRVKEREYMPDSFRLKFTHEGENRTIHVYVNTEAEHPRISDNQTIISSIHSDNSVSLLKKVMEQFGGQFCINDIEDQWTYIVKNPVPTQKEKDMMEAMVKIWDLTYKIPDCDVKHEIIRIAGSVIYADN